MINRVVLVGRVTKDPELRHTGQNIAVTNFNLAVNRTYTNSEGEREADFINCQVWRKAAENVAKYVSKGSLVGVEGRLQVRKYQDKEGQDRWLTEVVCESVQFLEPKKNNDGGQNNDYNNAPKSKSQPKQETQQEQEINIDDDDLPF